MNAKLELWVTDWSPNGTNDLLVVNAATGDVVEYVEAATFGLDVTKAQVTGMFFGEYGVIGELPHSDSNDHYDLNNVQVARITPAQLKDALCVSPLDPDGVGTLEVLRVAGVSLEEAAAVAAEPGEPLTLSVIQGGGESTPGRGRLALVPSIKEEE